MTLRSGGKSSSKTRKRLRKLMMMNMMNDTRGFAPNNGDVKNMAPFLNPFQPTGDNMDIKQQNLQILYQVLGSK
jgi:hypothetical protein